MKDIIKHEVIVIGSGFGGSVTAYSLAQAGVDVGLLERGPWRDTIPVRSMGIQNRVSLPRGWKSFTHILRSIQTPLNKESMLLNKGGLYEIFANKDMSVICSSGVGGGSHAYTALHGRANDPNYWDGVSEVVSENSMEKFHSEFLIKMDSRFPNETDCIPNLTNDSDGHKKIFNVGPNVEHYRMGVQFPKRKGQPQLVEDSSGIQRYEADYRDSGILGSFDGSKTTLDVAYLAEAMRNGLNIYDQREAINITRKNVKASARYQIETVNHLTGKKEVFVAEHVFLAAGTFNTLKLLFNSSSRDKSIHPIKNLGTRFSGNGDSIAYWMKNDEGKNYSIGTPCHGSLALDGDVEGPKFITVGFAFLEAMPVPGILKNRLMKDLLLIGFKEDGNHGCLKIEKSRLKLSYDKKLNPSLLKIRDSFALVSEQSGRRVIPFPTCTVHPMGGAFVHDNAEEGVINGFGELFSNEGLYVTDASALPKALGAPPSMSISAWSGHVSEQFLSRYGVKDIKQESKTKVNVA